jgi:hypothetical protein
LNHNPPDLCLLSSWDYRSEPPVPSSFFFFFLILILEPGSILTSGTHNPPDPPASASPVLGSQARPPCPAQTASYFYPLFQTNRKGPILSISNPPPQGNPSSWDNPGTQYVLKHGQMSQEPVESTVLVLRPALLSPRGSVTLCAWPHPKSNLQGLAPRFHFRAVVGN